jgi:hydrogenase-4 component F
MMLVFLVTVPAILGLMSLFVKNVRFALTVLLSASALHSLVVVLLWTATWSAEPCWLLQLDVIGLLFLTITSALFLAASLYSIPYLLGDTHGERAATHRFVPCLLWFLSCMTLVAVTQHLALMWAAVEGTTLASAPLVYFYKRKSALEAAWKYLLICSVGIALALLGTFFLGIAATASSPASPGLSLSALMAAAPSMARPWLKAAFVLALVGYGTKMGLVPLHTWLPDTHSQAPSPVSALLSGALLNCAFLAIMRFYQVCLASGDAAFAQTLLVTMGIISIAVACAFMVRQRDYKRLFAYSSIENMGIMAVGVGLGGAATYGAMFHAVNHSLCKAGLFFLSGNILREFGTTKVSDVRGLVRRLPVTGVLLTILFLAISGTPPFGPFWSEFMIFQTAINTHVWLGVTFITLLAIAFLGMAGVLLPMLQGNAASPAQRPREATLSVLTPLALASLVLGLGIYLPRFLTDLLRQAAGMLGG